MNETRDQMIRRLDQQDPDRFIDYGERSRQVEQAMAWTAAGRCGHCGGPVNEEGECLEDVK